MIRPKLQLCPDRLHHFRKAFHTSSNAVLTISRLLKAPPPEVERITIYGHIQSVRKQKRIYFASVSDGTSLEPLQAILRPQQAERLTNGAAVRLTGHCRTALNAQIQSHEMNVDEVDILGVSDPDTFPLQKQTLSEGYLRTMPHVRTRIPQNALLLRFRSQGIAGLTHFFAEQDFIQSHTPVITSSDCEGAGGVFIVHNDQDVQKDSQGTMTHFFKGPKYLTVSAQLHLEALAQSVGKVWTLSPNFRAEKSETARHQSEFYMLEAEVYFEHRLEAIMDLVEQAIKSMIRHVHASDVGREILEGKLSYETKQEASERRSILLPRWEGMMADGAWPRITYTNAIALLLDAAMEESFVLAPKWGSSLHTEHERFIARTVGQGSPVFVTEYPKYIKPFYMLPSDDLKTVQCFDLLVPEFCEIAGGSMREHRLRELIRSMRSSRIIPSRPGNPTDEDLGNLKWYVDLRRWGSAPHGGFGLGFDRLLAYLTGQQNIREMITFPRWVGRCDC